MIITEELLKLPNLHMLIKQNISLLRNVALGTPGEFRDENLSQICGISCVKVFSLMEIRIN